MTKSDKTGKPNEADTDAKVADEIIDAEIVEDPETSADDVMVDKDVSADDVSVQTDEDAVELSEPVDDPADGSVDEPVNGPVDDPADEPVELPQKDQPEDVAQDLPVDEPADEGSAVQMEEVRTDPAPQPSTQERKRAGFMPVFLGGVVAAGIGFGLATYMTNQGMLSFVTSNDAVADLTGKVAAQEALIRTLQTNQDNISGMATAANDLAGQGVMANAQLADMATRLDEMALLIVQLEDRVVTAEKRPMTEGASAMAIDAYEREVTALRTLVADQLAQAESLKQNSQMTAQDTLARAALVRIISAVDSGAPYRAALVELSSVSGQSAPAALEANADSGVTTMLVLVEDFPVYAREALADARSLAADEGGNKLTHFFKKQLGARSVTPKEGADADAILSRAEAALREGRLAHALGELDGLPETSQAMMADWRALAETRIAALSAVETLAQSLNNN